MNEPQELQVTIRFKVEHSPGTPEQLKQILLNYLRPKGVVYDINDNSIEI